MKGKTENLCALMRRRRAARALRLPRKEWRRPRGSAPRETADWRQHGRSLRPGGPPRKEWRRPPGPAPTGPRGVAGGRGHRPSERAERGGLRPGDPPPTPLTSSLRRGPLGRPGDPAVGSGRAPADGAPHPEGAETRRKWEETQTGSGRWRSPWKDDENPTRHLSTPPPPPPCRPKVNKVLVIQRPPPAFARGAAGRWAGRMRPRPGSRPRPQPTRAVAWTTPTPGVPRPPNMGSAPCPAEPAPRGPIPERWRVGSDTDFVGRNRGSNSTLKPNPAIGAEAPEGFTGKTPHNQQGNAQHNLLKEPGMPTTHRPRFRDLRIHETLDTIPYTGMLWLSASNEERKPMTLIYRTAGPDR